MGRDDDHPSVRPGDTMLSAVEAHDQEFGIETRRQKAQLESALFGEPETPIEIAHYTIIGTLGSGGMGVVYVAHDRQLDRRVALKLLRHAHVGRTAHARLQREAQAMARLSHPNVVTVHEVGTFRGQVFMAMEFVGGSNLRAWLRAEHRPWREIVAAFVQAGEGLAAAHDAGLIHRDFKPDNVLVGDDGRIRVADFGLAHGLDRSDSMELEADSTERGNIPLDTPLTETGVVVGTPAYMAPEQHAGERMDARTDQFAFCVALWEALYGTRPFPGSTLPELMAAVNEGRIDEPVDVGEVPPWLREVVRRGLAAKPGQRWSSMRELLSALTRDPERIRRRRLRVGGLITLALAIIAVLSARASTESHRSARQAYWNAVTAELLEIERERGLRQATEDARRAQNATRMSGYRRYRPKEGMVDPEDPTLAAALLREVDGDGRETEAWISAANEILSQPLSYAVLSGHRNFIMDVAFSPDSSFVYSASNDGEVRRWELDSGAGRTIISHPREVVSIAVSPDGRLVASAAKDRTARLWSSETPDAPARIIAEHEGELTMVRFAPDGRLLATASKDGTVKLVELASGETRTLTGHDGPVHALDFDAAGERLLTASGDRSAKLWRLADGRVLASFVGHEDAVYHARFVDDDRIVTGSDDGTVRAWTIADGGVEIVTSHKTAITALDVHRDRIVSAGSGGSVRIVDLDRPDEHVALVGQPAVWSVRFTKGGEQLVTGSFDGSARQWSATGQGPVREFLGHRQAVLRVAIDPTERWLATGSYDGDVRLWDLSQPRSRIRLTGHTWQIGDIAIDHAERRFATASRDGTARLWALDDGRELATLTLGGGGGFSVTFSPDDDRLAIGSQTGPITLFELDGELERELVGHTDTVWKLDFDDSGRRLASASFDGTARIWDLDSGDSRVIDQREGNITAVDFEPGGRQLVSAAADGTLHIWDTATGEHRVTLSGHTGRIWALVRSPDGRTLATASDDETARLWPSDDPADSLVLRGHRQPVWSIAFDDRGERVVTASYDGDARVWRVRDGSLIRTLSGHSETLWGARFVPDGRVVTISEDNTIRVWPATAGEPVIILAGHHDAVTDMAITRDGTRLISGSADATTQIWRLDRLTTDVGKLQRKLQRSTIWCLGVERRIRELGEDPLHAQQAYEACERSHGR